MLVWSLCWEDPLEKGMAAHSSILAWRIPWTEGLVGYSHRVAQSWTWLKQLVCCMKHTQQYVYMKVKVKVAQLCPTLYHPMDYRVNVILQARILKWVAFPFSGGSSQSRDRTQVSLIAGEFFTSWATREAQYVYKCIYYFAKGRVCIILVKLKAAWTDRGYGLSYYKADNRGRVSGNGEADVRAFTYSCLLAVPLEQSTAPDLTHSLVGLQELDSICEDTALENLEWFFSRLWMSIFNPTQENLFWGSLGISSEKTMAPTPVLLPGKPHGRRSLVGCSPWGR